MIDYVVLHVTSVFYTMMTISGINRVIISFSGMPFEIYVIRNHYCVHTVSVLVGTLNVSSLHVLISDFTSSEWGSKNGENLLVCILFGRDHQGHLAQHHREMVPLLNTPLLSGSSSSNLDETFLFAVVYIH